MRIVEVSLATALVLGFLNLVFVVVLVRITLRFGTRFPGIYLVPAYFLLRTVQHFWEYFDATVPSPSPIHVLTDLALICLAAYLVVTIGRTLGRLTSTLDETERVAREYRRALHDYERLVRHRLANPLTVISSGLETMDALGDAPANHEHRTKVLETMRQASNDLQYVSLAPSPLRPEERELDPTPHV